MPSLDPKRRLDDILESIGLIETYVAKAGGVASLLATANEYHDAVERRLLIISEAAVKLGALAERAQPETPWRNIRGLGNALRHDYDGVRDDIIALVLTVELPKLAAACHALKAQLSIDEDKAP